MASDPLPPVQVPLTPEERIREWTDRSPLPGLVWPGYDDGCITHVSALLRRSLRRPAEVPARLLPFAQSAERVVLIIVDGLGYHSLARFRSESPAVDRALSEARLDVLTSTVPSTTPVALASLYTGAAPREHGIVGATVYLRERGGTGNLLRFSPMDDPRRDIYLEQGLDLKAFCPVSSVFERLGRRPGGAAWVPAAIRDNALCRICTAGSEIHPFHTPAQAMVGVRKSLRNGGLPLQTLYWDATDTISHLRGPYSEELRAEVSAFFMLLENELLSADLGGPVRVLLTADHGHLPVRRESVVKLEDHPAIQACLMAPPLGGTRLTYLYPLPGKEAGLREACRALEDRFYVRESAELLERGLFGTGKEHPEARHRIGALTLVPRGDATFHRTDPVWFTAPFRGDHEGLSAEEMTVPLVMWEAGS